VSEVGIFRGEVNRDRLRGAIPSDVTKGDLILIPTVARRGGGFARGGACGTGGISRTRCARARRGGVGSSRSAGGISRTRGGARRIGGARGARGGTLANPEVVAVSEVSLLRGFAHRDRVLAIVAEGNLILAIATSPLFGEGHGYHKQQAQHHHCSYHAKDRHITAHTHPTPKCGWVCAMSLVGNIASKAFFSPLG
jgi:hypothetical protein